MYFLKIVSAYEHRAMDLFEFFIQSWFVNNFNFLLLYVLPIWFNTRLGTNLSNAVFECKSTVLIKNIVMFKDVV